MSKFWFIFLFKNIGIIFSYYLTTILRGEKWVTRQRKWRDSSSLSRLHYHYNNSNKLTFPETRSKHKRRKDEHKHKHKHKHRAWIGYWKLQEPPVLSTYLIALSGEPPSLFTQMPLSFIHSFIHLWSLLFL